MSAHGPGGPTIVADAPEPVTPDGFKGRVMCDFTARDDWVIPITVTDFTDRSDSIDVVFHIE